jgi:glyoxylase I family protein
MQILSTHHIGLSTGNVARLRAFYVDTLGLRVLGSFAEHEIVFVEAGDTVIELIGEAQSSDPRAPSPAGFERRGWQHIAWEIADVEAVYAELAAQGIAFQVPPEDFPPEAPSMRIAFFADPDGNLIELIQPLGARYPLPPPVR